MTTQNDTAQAMGEAAALPSATQKGGTMQTQHYAQGAGVTAPENNPMMAAALDLAAAGWEVFPLVENTKRPLTAHGVKDATTDADTIRAWWERNPEANLGLAPGADLLVLDVDTKHGIDGHDTLTGLGFMYGELPPTRTTETPSGGWHLYFKKPPELHIKNRVNVRPGLDVRTLGGYLVAPPSVIDGKPYRWLNDAPMADAPPWLVALVTEEKQPAPPMAPQAPTAAPRGAHDAYTQRAIERATNAVFSAGPGERNNELNAAAYGIARLAAADRLDWGQESRKLERAAVAAGLAPAEVRATLKSAWDAGSTDPNFDGMPRDNGQTLQQWDIDADTGELREVSAWPEPTPLPDDLPPVDAFDPELLPEVLRPWVMDIAQRMQCPPDFPAVAVITAISSVIGARAVVLPKVKDDWQVVPNLWGMIVGRPGVMKSPALTQAIGALNRLEGAAREAWQEKHREWELDCKVAALAAKSTEKQAEKEAAKNPEKARQLLAQQIDFEAENPKPPKRRYVVNDTTMEALADILTDNPWGLLVYRDEMHGLLCSMDKQGQEGARGFFLTGYDGNQGYAVDRIMRGHSYVDRVCLAMLGGIQPGKLQSYVRDAVTGGAGDDGLLQRFGLTVWPDVNQAFTVVDRWPDSEAKNAAGAVFDRLNNLEPDWDDAPQQWRFSPNAQALFYEWLVPFETSIRGDGMHPALVSHLAKWRKLVPALALIFAQVDTPESPGNQIHERELTRALAWAQYLLSHAKRVYSAATTPETFGAKHLLEKIKGGKLVDADGVLLETFAPRQVALKGWAGLAMVADARKAAETLTDFGWLARIEPAARAKGGRPSDLFQLHPCLLQRGEK